jgi:uncharacterized RmlC-like cupin family protein
VGSGGGFFDRKSLHTFCAAHRFQGKYRGDFGAHFRASIAKAYTLSAASIAKAYTLSASLTAKAYTFSASSIAKAYTLSAQAPL